MLTKLSEQASEIYINSLKVSLANLLIAANHGGDIILSQQLDIAAKQLINAIVKAERDVRSALSENEIFEYTHKIY